MLLIFITGSVSQCILENYINSKLLIFISSKNLRTIRKWISYENSGITMQCLVSSCYPLYTFPSASFSPCIADSSSIRHERLFLFMTTTTTEMLYLCNPQINTNRETTSVLQRTFYWLSISKANCENIPSKNVQLTLGSIPLEAIFTILVIAWFLERKKKPVKMRWREKSHVFVELFNFLLNTLVG